MQPSLKVSVPGHRWNKKDSEALTPAAVVLGPFWKRERGRVPVRAKAVAPQQLNRNKKGRLLPAVR